MEQKRLDLLLRRRAIFQDAFGGCGARRAIRLRLCRKQKVSSRLGQRDGLSGADRYYPVSGESADKDERAFALCDPGLAFSLYRHKPRRGVSAEQLARAKRRYDDACSACRVEFALAAPSFGGLSQRAGLRARP